MIPNALNMVTSCECKDTNECISHVRCFLLQFILDTIQYTQMPFLFSLLAALWSATQCLQGVRLAGTLFSDHFTITYFTVA